MTIDFYFDFVSPYAYLGWTQIHALAERHGRTVRPLPTLFAALLEHSGALGPAEIPAKRAYLARDTLRAAKAYGVAFEPPPTHPFNPLLALRVAGLAVDDDARRRVIDALYAAAWAGGGGVETADQVGRALERAGFDAAAMLAAATTADAKQQLRDATDAAIAAGVFGVPTMIADGELFWGCDSLPHLERLLAGGDRIAASDVERFLARESSARRR